MGKPRQLQIAGTEPVTIEELDAAAEEYRTFRDERMALAKKETEARVRVLDEMKKNNLNTYNYSDGEGRPRKVTLVTPDAKVSVKLIQKPKDSDPDDEDAGDGDGGGDESPGVDVS